MFGVLIPVHPEGEHSSNIKLKRKPLCENLYTQNYLKRQNKPAAKKDKKPAANKKGKEAYQH